MPEDGWMYALSSVRRICGSAGTGAPARIIRSAAQKMAKMYDRFKHDI
jgi:hypothetical protein